MDQKIWRKRWKYIFYFIEEKADALYIFIGGEGKECNTPPKNREMEYICIWHVIYGM